MIRIPCPSEAWDRYIETEEAIAEGACYEVAEKNGLTKEQAEICDDGHLQCVGCPWLEIKGVENGSR